MAANWILKHVYQKQTEPLQTMFEPNLVARQSIGTALNKICQ